MSRAMWLPGVVLLLGLTGCLGPQTHSQSAEDVERDKDLEAVRVVGDVTEVGNAAGLELSGVGLVTDLEDTGGSARGEWYAMLEKELRQRKIENVGQLLASPKNALVHVTAIIPPGCRKHDAIDLYVTLPDGSPATSLRGGYLQPCVLRNYETTKNLNPKYQGGNRLLQGHALAIGQGQLVVGFGNPGEPAALNKGIIWEGGISTVERPFFLVMKKDDKSARIANSVASRINLKFPDDGKKQEFVQKHRQLYLLEDVTQQLNNFEPGGIGRGDAAKAVNGDLVNVRVPYAYRYNPERYLRVARLIPLTDDAAQMSKYRQRLQKMLLEPRDCIRAALRLEALGKDSIATLKKGLDSPHVLVKFAAAESLVYLGSTSGVEALAELARNQDNVRAYALIALAGLNEAVCRSKLQELLATDNSELRAGAFQALRLTLAEECRFETAAAAGGQKQRDRDADLERVMRRLGGEDLQAFWLHQVAPNNAKSVNFADNKRAEIVMFGSDIRLVAPVQVRAGEEFIVTAKEGDDRCYVSRISERGSDRRVACSLQLDDVLRKLVALGGQFPDAVDLLRRLHNQQGLNCPVERLTPPQAAPLEELLAESRDAVRTGLRPPTNGGE